MRSFGEAGESEHHPLQQKECERDEYGSHPPHVVCLSPGQYMLPRHQDICLIEQKVAKREKTKHTCAGHLRI